MDVHILLSPNPMKSKYRSQIIYWTNPNPVSGLVQMDKMGNNLSLDGVIHVSGNLYLG